MSNSPTLSELAAKAKQSDTPLRSALEIALDENNDSRLQRRRSIKKILFQNELLARRQKEIRDCIAKIESEVEQAVADHELRCKPIQQWLKEIDDQEISAMLESSKLDEVSIEKRTDLRSQVDAFNNELETISEASEKKIKLLRKELGEVGKQIDTRFTVSSLQHPDVANPQLCDALFISQQGIRFCEARFKTACEHIARYKDELLRGQQPSPEVASTSTIGFNGQIRTSTYLDASEIAIYQRRLNRWELESSVAQKALADAMAESERIVDKIRAE